MDLQECKINTEHYRRQLEIMDKVLRQHFSQLSEISAKMKTHEDTHPNEVTRIVDTKLMEVRGERREGEILMKMRAEAMKEAQDLTVEVKMLRERLRRSEERQDKQILEMKAEKERMELEMKFEMRALKGVVEDLRQKTEALKSSTKMEIFSAVVIAIAIGFAICFLILSLNSTIRKPQRYLQRFRKLPTPIQATSDTEAENSRSSRRRLNLN